MTVLKRVSAKEMKKRTGFGKALGYSFPEEDEILIRDDLPKDLEHEVIAHEEEHAEKGEEGPFLDFLGTIFGAKKQADSAKDATRAQERAAEAQLAFAREESEYAKDVQAPYVSAGHRALAALESLVGLGTPGAATAAPGDTLGVLGVGQRGPSFNYNDIRTGFPGGGNVRGSAYRSDNIRPRYSGGPMRGETYNVNELGPESVYSNGAYTRNANPTTISGQDGYVQPHGRAFGGFMGGAYDNSGQYPSYSPPNKDIGGASGPANRLNTTAINPQTGYPNENPGGVEGGYQFQTEPGYQFRFSEGQRALDRGAAARGGLLSGGYGRKAIRYGQGFASNEYQNVYNRISNIAGLGQTSGAQSGQTALQGAYQQGNAAGNAGYARASGYAAQGDIWGNALQGAGNFAQDWWNNRRPKATESSGWNPYTDNLSGLPGG